MCGFVGVWTPDYADFKTVVGNMQKKIIHRGKDGEGFFYDHSFRMGMAHRRLGTIGLSDPHAHQPLKSGDERYVITYNGEVYNFKELAAQFGIPCHRGAADTSIVLEVYKKKGIEAFTLLNGMFALCIWDTKEKKVILARDRHGIKPLYWFFSKNAFSWGSEIKALLSCHFIPSIVSRQAAAEFFHRGAICPPRTIVESVFSLLPGTYIECFMEKGLLQINGPLSYIKPAFLQERANSLSNQKTAETIKEFFYDSIKKQIACEKPIGIFLSGGMDSTALAYSIRKADPSLPLFTFTLGHSSSFAEHEAASEVAREIQAEHTEWIVTETDFKKLFSSFVQALDQPTVDGLNTFLISLLSSKKVEVVYSGVGGDEYFGGYQYYKQWHFRKEVEALPCSSFVLSFLSFFKKIPFASSILYRLNMLSLADSLPEHYLRHRAIFSEAEVCALLGQPPFSLTEDLAFQKDDDSLGALLRADQSKYMLSTLLRDTDAFSMFHTLEVRVPFLDNDLCAYMQQLSVEKVVGSSREPYKPLLAASLASDVPFSPASLYKKQGFELPIGEWLSSFGTELDYAVHHPFWKNNTILKKELSLFASAPWNYRRMWAAIIFTFYLDSLSLRFDSVE